MPTTDNMEKNVNRQTNSVVVEFCKFVIRVLPDYAAILSVLTNYLIRVCASSESCLR